MCVLYMCGMWCVYGESGCEWCVHVLICVVWDDGVCVGGGGMRQRCSIKKTFTASRLITLQMKYTCTHIQQILTSGNQKW